MLPGVDVITDHVFDIYSLGDALFMKRVMQGVVMLGSSGIIRAMALLGMMIGLIMMAVNTAMTGFKKFEFPWLLLSLVLFAVLFVPKSNVVIHEVHGGPGVTPGGSYLVKGVPFGLAATGSIISGVGHVLARKFHVAFSDPEGGATGNDDDGSPSLGRSLEWINAVRNWSLPHIAEGTGTVARFKTNLASYWKGCVAPEMQYHQIDPAKIARAPNPFVPVADGGIIVTDPNRMVAMLPISSGPPGSGGAAAAPQPKTCTEAGAQIQGVAAGEDDTLFTAFAAAIAPHNLTGGPGSDVDHPEVALQQSFSDVGMSAKDAQKYVATAALAAVWGERAQGGASDSASDLSTIMMNQAVRQRAQQWGGEESMFLHVAGSMTAFFESMIYAVAPFMAFVLGFGPFGMKMLVRYLVMTLWVALWAPVLALVSLFQTTNVHHSINAMLMSNAQAAQQATGPPDVTAGALAMSPTSVSGVVFLQGQVIDWLATGAELAAATPMISLMLLFGGAFTATALATRLQGGDHINERIASPDVVQPGAGMDVQPMQSYSQGEGAQQVGFSSSAPKFALNRTAQRAVSSSLIDRSTDSHAVISGFGGEIAVNSSRMRSHGVQAMHEFTAGVSTSEVDATKMLVKYGADVKTAHATAATATAAATLEGGVNGGGVVAAGFGGEAVGFGGNLNAKANISLSGKSGYQTANSIDKAITKMRSENQDDYHQFQRDVAFGLKDQAKRSADITGSNGLSAKETKSLNEAYSHLESTDRSYNEAVSVQNAVNSGQTMTDNQFVQSMNRPENEQAHDAFIEQTDRLGNEEVLHANRQWLRQHAQWRTLGSAAVDTQARLMMLRGQTHGGQLDPSKAGDRAQAAMHAYDEAGLANGAVGASVVAADAHRYQGEVGGARASDAYQNKGSVTTGRGLSSFTTSGVKSAADGVGGVSDVGTVLASSGAQGVTRAQTSVTNFDTKRSNLSADGREALRTDHKGYFVENPGVAKDITTTGTVGRLVRGAEVINKNPKIQSVLHDMPLGNLVTGIASMAPNVPAE